MHNKAFGLVKNIVALGNIDLEGIFTHLACADTNKDLTLRQISLFDSLVKRLRSASITIPLVHAANSMGVVAFKNSHFNMVRPGLILYGLSPREDLSLDLRPVMALKTRVIYIKNVSRGCGVSYGHTYVTRSATKIATLPIGYGDGYPRNLSNIAPVLINGRRFMIAGRVCMDQFMVDVGTCPVKVGDEVVLIGSQGAKHISAESLAALSLTIPYEIVCGIGSRVPRVYAGNRSSADSRKAPRHAARIPVRFYDGPSLADTFGVAEDISSSGLKLRTPDRVLPYRQLNLILEQPDKPPLTVSGEAVWSRPDSNGLYVSGIRLARRLPENSLAARD